MFTYSSLLQLLKMKQDPAVYHELSVKTIPDRRRDPGGEKHACRFVGSIAIIKVLYIPPTICLRNCLTLYKVLFAMCYILSTDLNCVNFCSDKNFNIYASKIEQIVNKRFLIDLN